MDIGPKRPRERDPAYLTFLRAKPCCLCGGKSEACHIRSSSMDHDKPHTGMGTKPDDKWSVPMCRSCHMTQHSGNELQFWNDRGIDPFALAMRYYAQYQASGKVGIATTNKPRTRTTITPRGFGPSRPFDKQKRPFR